MACEPQQQPCSPHDARVACSWQLVLKRAIGLKKDEYFIDRKHVTKTEVPCPNPTLPLALPYPSPLTLTPTPNPYPYPSPKPGGQPARERGLLALQPVQHRAAG